MSAAKPPGSRVSGTRGAAVLGPAPGKAPRLAFFDTNILVHADDAGAPAKQALAARLITAALRERTAVFSTQVLQEYFVAATRKIGVPPETAQRKVELLARANIVVIGVAEVVAAIELHRLRGVSFWDGLILHAARISGAAVLYSEDLQHGAAPAGVRIENPFRGL